MLGTDFHETVCNVSKGKGSSEKHPRRFTHDNLNPRSFTNDNPNPRSFTHDNLIREVLLTLSTAITPPDLSNCNDFS